ncbi:MAG: FlgO family outer membrane protein [Saprospiraceae bacterium]
MKLISNFFYHALPVFFVLLTLSYTVAQGDFDAKLTTLSDTIAKKINLQGKKVIAVWDFTDNDGQITNLGKYLSEEISINLTNYSGSFHMMDRNHLNTILREHKLNAEGFIDANTAKELGKMNAVDAIVTGTMTIFPDKIKLTIKVLDTETALIIAATKGDLPITPDIASFIGVPDMAAGNASTTNRGFNNRPLSSNEQLNNPETVNKECETNNYGDYCFQNNTQFRLKVILYYGTNNGHDSDLLTLDPNQTQCLYNLKAKSYDYRIDQLSPSFYMEWKLGSILIEKCKSKTFVIK